MTTYQGGKKRLGKQIYNIILDVEYKLTNGSGGKMPYFEPFIGMAGVMCHFASSQQERPLIACDINSDLICMWQAIQDGWIPPINCSRQKYEKLKTHSASDGRAETKQSVDVKQSSQDVAQRASSAERGFIGIVASWGGIWFSSYRLGYSNSRNFLREGRDGLLKIKNDMKKVKFLDARPYYDFNPSGMLIYCDPPYKENRLRHSEYFSKFDHAMFWEIMRKWSRNGNIVVVSERVAPTDFIPIVELSSTVTNSPTRHKKYKEYLFIFTSLVACNGVHHHF